MTPKQCLQQLYDEGANLLTVIGNPSDSDLDIWKIKVVVQIARLYDEDSIEFRQIQACNFEAKPRGEDNSALDNAKRQIRDGLAVLRALYELEDGS